MATVWDPITMPLPRYRTVFICIASHRSNDLTLQRSNFAMVPVVKMTFAWLSSIIILTVDNVLSRFCACGGRIATGTTSAERKFSDRSNPFFRPTYQRRDKRKMRRQDRHMVDRAEQRDRMISVRFDPTLPMRCVRYACASRHT